jgi:hypothetical protein
MLSKRAPRAAVVCADGAVRTKPETPGRSPGVASAAIAMLKEIAVRKAVEVWDAADARFQRPAAPGAIDR